MQKLFNPVWITFEIEERIFISTNDVASNENKNDILSVTMRGWEFLTNFVKKRLLPHSTGNIHDPIPKTNPKHLLIWQTYVLLHHRGKVKILKLTGIYSEFSGREIDLGNLLHYELAPCSCVFESNTSTNRHISNVLNHLLSDKFARNVLPDIDHFSVIYTATWKNWPRIDLVYDDYRIQSINQGHENNEIQKKTRKIRRVIDSCKIL